MLSEISQTEKDKYCKVITYMWNLKNNSGMNECNKTETDSQVQRTNGYQREEEGVEGQDVGREVRGIDYPV